MDNIKKPYTPKLIEASMSGDKEKSFRIKQVGMTEIITTLMDDSLAFGLEDLPLVIAAMGCVTNILKDMAGEEGRMFAEAISETINCTVMKINAQELPKQAAE